MSPRRGRARARSRRGTHPRNRAASVLDRAAGLGRSPLASVTARPSPRARIRGVRPSTDGSRRTASASRRRAPQRRSASRSVEGRHRQRGGRPRAPSREGRGRAQQEGQRRGSCRRRPGPAASRLVSGRRRLSRFLSSRPTTCRTGDRGLGHPRSISSSISSAVDGMAAAACDAMPGEIKHAPPWPHLDEELSVPWHELDLVARSGTQGIPDGLRHRDLTLAGQTGPPRH